MDGHGTHNVSTLLMTFCKINYLIINKSEIVAFFFALNVFVIIGQRVVTIHLAKTINENLNHAAPGRVNEANANLMKSIIDYGATRLQMQIIGRNSSRGCCQKCKSSTFT